MPLTSICIIILSNTFHLSDEELESTTEFLLLDTSEKPMILIK